MNWKTAGNYQDIFYHKSDGIAKVTINRPHKRNAFRPKTVSEMYQAFLDAREDPDVGVVLLTGAGPHTDGKYAFCSGGDQSVRGDAGYMDDAGVPRLNVLDLQKLIRSMPKVVIALVSGYAIGGGQPTASMPALWPASILVKAPIPRALAFIGSTFKPASIVESACRSALWKEPSFRKSAPTCKPAIESLVRASHHCSH